MQGVRADNPGPLTLDGSNSWIVGTGDGPVIVVDPGPAVDGHASALAAAIGERPVVAILLTHGHPDHAAGAPGFADRVGAPVRAIDAALCRNGPPLVDGERVTAGDVVLQALATPGHTADSACFLVPESGALLTGDTVLGRGSALIDHPDGRLADYLRSLQRLIDLSEQVSRIFPGHGPESGDPARLLKRYLDHREDRLGQLRAALETGAGTVDELIALVYSDLDESLWPAAVRSVEAQLAYLDGQ